MASHSLPLSARFTQFLRPVVARGFHSIPDGSNVPNFIDGKLVDSKSDKFTEHTNPATGELISRIPDSTPEEMQQAVDSAAKAFESWKEVPTSSRIRIIMNFMEILKKNESAIISDITKEHGKTAADAKGEVVRGLDILEHACTLSARHSGSFHSNVGKEVDTYSYKVPLGVTATVMPFNFPFMCPLWSVPLALATGNTVVMKPSHLVPHGGMNIATMLTEAGLPDGCLNVIHGTERTVNFIIEDPTIKAISFVGSNPAGEHIFKNATPLGKRVQANLGAKNHIVIMPDADKETALNAITGSAYGAAGQRCMANSVGVFVGAAKEWIPELAARTAALKVNEGNQAGADLGPVITPAALARAKRIAKGAVAQGATMLHDGTDLVVPGYEKGNFLGPTLIGDVTADMECYTEEIFAPVFCCTTVDTLPDAIDFVNANPYGNGTAIITSSGAAARKFQYEIECGQVGINVAIPVGLYFNGFCGWKKSFMGSNHFYGQDGVDFFCETRSVIQNWQYSGSQKMEMSFPTNK